MDREVYRYAIILIIWAAMIWPSLALGGDLMRDYRDFRRIDFLPVWIWVAISGFGTWLMLMVP